MALLNYAISLDWDGKSARPGWMRQKDFLPCDCNKCYFCKNGHTSGACRREIGSTPLHSSAVSENVQRNARQSELRLDHRGRIVDCATRGHQRIWKQNKRREKARNQKWDVVHVKWWFVKNAGQSLLMAWNCKSSLLRPVGT